MKKRRFTLLLALLGVMLVTGVALAGSSANYAIPWEVIGRGGNEMSSSNYAVRSTAGQAIIGPTESISYRLGAGYWYGIGDVTVPSNFPRIYLPIVVKSY